MLQAPIAHVVPRIQALNSTRQFVSAMSQLTTQPYSHTLIETLYIGE